MGAKIGQRGREKIVRTIKEKIKASEKIPYIGPVEQIMAGRVEKRMDEDERRRSPTKEEGGGTGRRWVGEREGEERERRKDA